MARIEGAPYTGLLIIDLNDVKEYLVDLPHGVLKGARAEKEGIANVLAELEHTMPNYGDDAEIHPATYKRVVDASVGIDKLRAKEIALEKALEIVRESRGRLENNREDDLSSIATTAEDKATRGKKPDLLAHFDKTIKYKSQIADKGAETRRKNEEAKAAAAGEKDKG